MRNKIIALSLILSVVVCNLSGFEIVQAAKKTTLKTKTLSVNVGKTKSITLKNKSSKNKYTYKSSNKQVATVTKKGKVKGLKKGTTRVTITETIKAKKKTRKVGVCKVTVKSTNSITPIVTQLPTQVPINNATQVPNLIVTNSPEPTITESPTQMPKPTVVPAYETMNLEYDGTGVIPLTTAMIYGGLCTVSGTITQSSGSTQMVRVGYEGEYLNFTRNGSYISSSSVDPMSEYKEVEVTSGVEVPFTLVFELPKYSYDFNLQFVSDNSIDFNVKDLVMETKPFESAEYSKMVEESLSSSGNNARIKKAIEKARAGEDVTLAYIGGSITEGFAASETKNSDCYAETSYNQFKQTYGAGDGENVHFINAGMSGTPSTLGVIRYQRDVLDQMKHGTYPDVLFIDFAVNDGGDCGEAYESLIRTALAN